MIVITPPSLPDSWGGGGFYYLDYLKTEQKISFPSLQRDCVEIGESENRG